MRPAGTRVVAVAAGTCAVLVVLPFYASFASAPARVGWWNSATVGAATAPSPTTPAGGLRVAATFTQVSAYGAVLFAVSDSDGGIAPGESVPAAGSATLRLHIAAAHGAPSLQACPTVSHNWKAGNDQPFDQGPQYDCTAEHYPGKFSADGSTVTFTLSQLTTGSVSMAVVPDLSVATSLFDVDLAAPGQDAISVSAAPGRSRPATGDNATPAGAGQSLPNAAPRIPQEAISTLPGLAPGGRVPAPLTASQPGGPSLPTFPAAAAAEPQVGTPALRAVAGASSTRRQAGSALGMVTLALVLLLWATGRGLLGGRISPLSVPLRKCQLDSAPDGDGLRMP